MMLSPCSQGPAGYYFFYLSSYIPEEGKKLMKKIEVWSSTNPGGWKTKNRRAKAPR